MTCRCNNCNNKCGQPHLCVSKQDFCTRHGETAAGIGYPLSPAARSVKRDDIIIKLVPQAELNRWIQYVKDLGNKNTGPSGLNGHSGSSNAASAPGLSTAAENRDFVYADKINQLINDMIALNPSNDPGVRFSRDQVIYASDIQKIISKLNAMKVNSKGCCLCVSSCNTCNSCLSTCCCTH